MPGSFYSPLRELPILANSVTTKLKFVVTVLVATAIAFLCPGQVSRGDKDVPQILSTSPAQNELNVPVSAEISVTFDADMDETTINDSTFMANGRSTGLHQGTISYDTQTRTATLYPSDHFEHGEMVTAVLTSGVQSSEEIPIGNSHTWYFIAEATEGPGSFAPYSSYMVGDGPQCVFVADLNNDGHLDLVTANWFSNTASVFLNNGDGTFATPAEYPTGGSPFSVFAADLDSDGDIDLAIANSFSSNVSVLLNTGGVTFSPDSVYPVGIHPYSIVSGDLDGDGDSDLVTANEIANTVSVLLNNGNATFSPSSHYPTGDNPASVATGDVDGDGDVDLVTANHVSDNVSVMLNYGDGIFAPHLDYPVSSRPFSVCCADLNGDGNIDLATANLDVDNVSVLLGNGDGTFSGHAEYAVGGVSRSVFAADLDGDGDLDLATANHVSGNVSVLFNNGDGTFSAHTEYSASDSPVSLFAADLDGDGDLDLATANVEADNACVLLNELLSECALWASPDTVIVGQTIALHMRVENTGSVYADSVTPSISLLGDGSVGLDSGPVPAYTDIAPGSDAVFAWTFWSEDVHLVYWKGYASGIDRGTGNVATSLQDTSNAVLIQSPPDLAFVPNSLEPDTLTQEQVSGYTVAVRNNGEAWLKLTPQSTFSFSDAGGETLRTQLTDSTLVDGLVQNAMLAFDAVTVSSQLMDGNWQSWLHVEGSGRNGYSHSFTLPGDMVTIQEKAEVEDIAAALTPAEVSQGQPVAFSIEVTNSGGVGVVLDTTSRFSFTDGTVTYDSYLAGPDTVNVGVSNVLELTSETIPSTMREGTYPIMLYLDGYDLNGAEYFDTVTTTGRNEVTVEIPACLEGLVSMVNTDTVYWGQQNVDIGVVIQNGGGADALIESTNLRFVKDQENLDDEYEVTLLNPIDSLLGSSTDMLHFRVNLEGPATEGWVTIHCRIFGRDANSMESIFDTTTTFPDSLCVLSYRCGDCNGDGFVTFGDALYLKNYYYQTPPGSPPPIGEADVNLDGFVNFADALYIKNYYYQTPPGSPPPCEPPKAAPPFGEKHMEMRD